MLGWQPTALQPAKYPIGSRLKLSNRSSDTTFRFTLIVKIDKNLKPLERDTLIQLGSYGLANRIDFLNSEGFIK